MPMPTGNCENPSGGFRGGRVSAPLPGTMLGRYKISLMSSYLEFGHSHAM